MNKWQVMYCRVAPLFISLFCMFVTITAIQNQQFQTADLAVKVGAGYVLPVSMVSMIYNAIFYSRARKFWIEEESIITSVEKGRFVTSTGREYLGSRIELNFKIGTTVSFLVNSKNNKQYCLLKTNRRNLINSHKENKS